MTKHRKKIVWKKVDVSEGTSFDFHTRITEADFTFESPPAQETCGTLPADRLKMSKPPELQSFIREFWGTTRSTVPLTDLSDFLRDKFKNFADHRFELSDQVALAVAEVFILQSHHSEHAVKRKE